ncbi:unnamed protein product [Mesocestoides corti]|uniref:SH3 domain-containing protein n=1 Tax=Mesocestoides corti TaxID=53468 RepID=A0A0R3UD26_MESCO|nr:unnamed protein product [Mesocestoides corti]
MDNSTSAAAANTTTTTANSSTPKAANSTESPTVLARAIYDNNSEVAQELSFSRGDVLTVLKQDPPGFEGWWICSFAGKVGIAPGNRLEILGVVKVRLSRILFYCAVLYVAGSMTCVHTDVQGAVYFKTK